MVSAVFSRLRTLPTDAQLPTMPSSAASLADSLSQGAADDQVGLGLRMSAPDPRGAGMPGAEEKAQSVNGEEVDGLGAPQLEKLPFEREAPPESVLEDDGQSAPRASHLRSLY